MAGQGMGPGPGVKGYSAGDTYSDIVFWWTAEADTLGEDDYSAGDTTATATGSGLAINTTAAIVGSNGIYTATSGSRYYSFSVSSNDIIPAAGRVGFWVTNPNTTKVSPIYWQNSDATSRIQLDIENNDVSFYWRDSGTGRTACTSTADVISTGTHFIEIAFDTDYREIFVDGESVLSCATTTTQQTAISWVAYGDFDPTADTSAEYMDNIMVSNSTTRDLYALRNLTASPR